MKIYLVGGAVRDQLLHLPVTDRDWVVVGARREQLIELGYQQVGKDFPVFLHPKTHEAYALARTERKKGTGYTGFVCHADPNVTLQEDLLRRDLTINAIAQREDGSLYDPFGGHSDLMNRWLRHVSPAFVEDPLRVLRVARLAARFFDQGFKVWPATLNLMKKMTLSGELVALTPERIYHELLRALTLPAAHVFFEVLNACGARRILFPEFEAIPEDWMKQLLQSGHCLFFNQKLALLFTTLCYEQGTKGALERLERFTTRLKVTKKTAVFLEAAVTQYEAWHRIEALTALELLHFFTSVARDRHSYRWKELQAVYEIVDSALAIAEKKGKPSQQAAEWLNAIFLALPRIQLSSEGFSSQSGSEIQQALYAKRIEFLEVVIADYVHKKHGLA